MGQCRDLTVLVGKNEAGKSAIPWPVQVEPSDEEKYDGLREFPAAASPTTIRTPRT